jgi:effector-binding domain-containing protein
MLDAGVPARAQTPPSTTAPAQSTPIPPAPPPAAAPAQPPAASPPPPPAAAAPQPPAAPGTTPAGFAEEVTFPEKTVVTLKGHANWDSAFETLVDSFKSVYGFMEKAGLKADGPSLIIYTSTDDTGFTFQAAVPIATAPADLPKGDIEVGKSPTGRMLRFIHRGSYDSMDSTYELITNYLDTKQLEAQDTFIEEYITDPVNTAEDKLIINVWVPLKGK